MKNRNINLLILLILLLFLLQLNFFNVSGDIFYVGTNGSDANSCTKDEPCLTLEQGTLRGSANDSTECIVFVMDKTTLSTEFIIYSILLPRTFTNNPENGTDQSEIQINIGGQFRITGNSLFERIKFTMQDGVSNENGGVIYTSFMSSPRTLEITNCSFVGCKATDSGSALCLYVINEVELTLRNLSFNHCETQTIGGALFAQIQSGGKLTISGSCLFTDCIASQTGSSGGAIRASIDGENSQLIFEDSMTFNGCSAFGGGGISLQITNKGHLMMTGSWLFTNCNSTQHDGGGCKISVYGPNFYIQLLGNMYFEDCESGQNGGGLNFYSESTGQVTINEMSFSKCNSAFNGGGFCSRFESGALMTITGRITFEKCNSSGDNYGGGGQYIIANGSGCVVNITGKLEYKQCQANLGGGLFADIRDNAILEINKASFQNCISNSHGGGIFSNISSGGQLILNKSCEFYQCQSNGNGGGIYIMIDISTQCAFVIKDTFIHECKALNSTNSSLTLSQSGFGGCLFLAGNGDYDPSTELIDLRGMKIYNNQAYRYGQSIYIVTTKIVEFCKYGILGEYVKGNYSDTYSNEQELVGISMDLITFNISTSEEIRQLQQTLEPLWRILGILNGAQVTVNVSNPNGKLVFILEGQRMVPKYLNMKIFELRDKTQEEMDLEQQEMNFYYNKNNFKSLRRTQQSQITLKHQKADQQQISINSNIKIKKNLHNYANEIIYPPEDGSSIPIQIDGELESEQKATFGMNDYQWLNYKEKIYAVLISNDRNIFSGKDGVTVEEDLNAAVQLEVIIEEEDGKEKGLPIGIIVGIAVGALAIVAVIIIIIIVAVFISKKKKAKNAKKPASSYDPEMRARNLPMENQFPQNSHSLDAVNKAMESNNW
ncbi:MAG: hypothetical protein EZS28_010488 [Streblomastix strix]|uniref:Right handed beta helix domain-containing protein n=1 Tax=Streblomastix strix TaxID=222440 RepID=A0A5J4WGF8_9EUKA|nr:MAG: hypothetical protein EZS28_010488 [Streblomastix strix]